MSRKAKFILALTGVVVVLTCELVVVFDRTLAARPILLLAFGIVAALGFWAMSFHRLGR